MNTPPLHRPRPHELCTRRTRPRMRCTSRDPRSARTRPRDPRRDRSDQTKAQAPSALRLCMKKPLQRERTGAMGASQAKAPLPHGRGSSKRAPLFARSALLAAGFALAAGAAITVVSLLQQDTPTHIAATHCRCAARDRCDLLGDGFARHGFVRRCFNRRGFCTGATCNGDRPASRLGCA